MTDEVNLEDIVVLRHVGNGCYMEVVKFTDKSLNEPNLSIDFKLGIWNYIFQNPIHRNEWKNIPIGKARSVQGDNSDEGVIGVYNIKYFEQIRSMVNAAVEFSKEPANYIYAEP